MKKLFILFMAAFSLTSLAQDSAFVFKPAMPIRIDRDVNIAYDINIKDAKQGDVVNFIEVQLDENAVKSLENISLYYTGTTSMVRSKSKSISLSVDGSNIGGGQMAYCNPANAILIQKIDKPTNKITFKVDRKLVNWNNYFYISVKAKPNTELTQKFDLNIVKITINNKNVAISNKGFAQPYRVGVSVRNSGDDKVNTYRIPGIVTAKDGSLIGIYDIRRANSVDLQGDVQVGASRSLDKGRTWQPMQAIVDMRGYNGLPDNQNGTGDAAIAVDEKTGKLYTMALWTHGIGEQLSWWNVKQGITPEDQTAQVVIVESNDNGKTWSKPYNITPQIKDSSWHIVLQGPGRGIVTKNGTIVFPFQYTDSTKNGRMPFATIVYSKDGGKNWSIGTPARSNTTEAQVVELSNGELMLNSRDNRGGSRAVLITNDLGKTWSEHSSNRSALIESVCMASLIKVEGKDNATGKDILIFSNPNTTKGRINMTIKVSLDEGKTWLPENQILLDSEPNWGYSCLTMVDKNTVGILYESSTAQMLFQAIPIKDLIKK